MLSRATSPVHNDYTRERAKMIRSDAIAPELTEPKVSTVLSGCVSNLALARCFVPDFNFWTPLRHPPFQRQPDVSENGLGDTLLDRKGLPRRPIDTVLGPASAVIWCRNNRADIDEMIDAVRIFSCGAHIATISAMPRASTRSVAGIGVWVRVTRPKR